MIYRITRTTLRGPFENHACFTAALAVAEASAQAVTIETVPDAGNTGGPNDRSFTIWLQVTPFALPATCDPDLITSAGKNGWATEAEARAVLAGILAGHAQVNANVAAANAAAVSPGNIAASVAKDAGKVADVAAGAVAGAAGAASALWLVEALGAGLLAWWAAKRWLGKGA